MTMKKTRLRTGTMVLPNDGGVGYESALVHQQQYNRIQECQAQVEHNASHPSVFHQEGSLDQDVEVEQRCAPKDQLGTVDTPDRFQIWLHIRLAEHH
jgi:hypothetical protein